jgi:hypothetical protein
VTWNDNFFSKKTLSIEVLQAIAYELTLQYFIKSAKLGSILQGINNGNSYRSEYW